jgi:hypothetical protein
MDPYGAWWLTAGNSWSPVDVFSTIHGSIIYQQLEVCKRLFTFSSFLSEAEALPIFYSEIALSSSQV